MINIEGNNKLHDFYRLLWYIVPLAASFALGFLFCHYKNVESIIQNNRDLNVTCSLDSLPPVIIQGCSPKTGV